MTVIISERAQASEASLLDFVAEISTVKAAERLKDEIRSTIAGLAKLPHQWQRVDTLRYGTVHRIVVASQTIILYRVEGDLVTILDIFDARSNWR